MPSLDAAYQCTVIPINFRGAPMCSGVMAARPSFVISLSYKTKHLKVLAQAPGVGPWESKFSKSKCKPHQQYVTIWAGRWTNWEQPWQELGGAGGSRPGHDPATQPRKPNVSWPAAKAVWPAGRGFCWSTPLWWEPTWSAAFSSRVLSTRMTLTCWSKRKLTKMIRGMEHLFYWKRLRAEGVFILDKK